MNENHLFARAIYTPSTPRTKKFLQSGKVFWVTVREVRNEVKSDQRMIWNAQPVNPSAVKTADALDAKHPKNFQKNSQTFIFMIRIVVI